MNGYGEMVVGLLPQELNGLGRARQRYIQSGGENGVGLSEICVGIDGGAAG